MRIFLLMGLWGLAATLQAGLKMDQDPLQLHPKPEDEEVESTFTFTNTGKKPVLVTGLESSCSCLEATLDKRVYQPGEKGTGKAKFKVSSFTGRHEKFLHIYTDDPDARDVVLNAVIDVPIIVEVEPKTLEWVIGDKPEPKQFHVKMVGKDEIHVQKVVSSREGMKAEFAEIKPGREYEVTVTPVNTDNVLVGFAWIETDSKIAKYQRTAAFYNIMSKEQLERRRKLEQEEKEEDAKAKAAKTP